MKIINQVTHAPCMVWLIVFVVMGLDPSGPTAAVALAGIGDDDSPSGSAPRAAQHDNANRTDREDEESVQPNAARDDDEDDADDADEDWLDTMRNVPEETKRLIGEFRRAGLRIRLTEYAAEEGSEADRPGGNPRTTVTVTFRTAAPARPGFQAEFMGKALEELLRSLPGIDSIDFSGTNVTNENLQQLRRFPSLTELDLAGTRVTSKGLAGVAWLRELSELNLSDTHIGDSELAHLRGLTRLRSLWLDGTRVSDAGLQNLQGMRDLQQLSLARTEVSDAGLVNLRDLPVRHLWLDATRVTDAGLVHIKEGMSKLRHLSLMDTNVTKAGIDQLMRDAPNLRDRTEGDTTTRAISWGSTRAKNPARTQPATQDRIARLKDALWWLPEDSEFVVAAHGPFTLRSLREPLEWEHDDALSTVRLFYRSVRPAFELLNADTSGVETAPVALIVHGGRCSPSLPIPAWVPQTSEGCQIVIFERPLGDKDSSFTSAVAERATKIDTVGRVKVAQVHADQDGIQSTSFIAMPSPDVLLFGSSRDYVETVLTRMAKNPEALRKDAKRALPDSLTEWSYVDLTARQWALRHSRQPSRRHADWPFHGLAYSVQAGDLAKVVYVFHETITIAAAQAPFQYFDVELRKIQPKVIEAGFNVGNKQALGGFFNRLFHDLTM